MCVGRKHETSRLEAKDSIIHGFIPLSVPLIPSFQGAKVKEPTWIQQHCRFTSQLRNIKRREPKDFMMGCKQTDLCAERDTLSILQGYSIYKTVLEMIVQSQRAVSALAYKINTSRRTIAELKVVELWPIS